MTAGDRRSNLALRLALGALLCCCALWLLGCSLRQAPAQEPAPVAPKEKRQVLADKELNQVLIYYVTQDGRYLAPVHVAVNPTRAVAKVAVEKLLAGPKADLLKSPIPGEVKLIDVYLIPDRQVIYVDLTRKLTEIAPARQADLAVEALVLTLTDLYPAYGVQVLVEGQGVARLGNTSTGQPLPRPAAFNALGEVKAGQGVRVYFADRSAAYLIPAYLPLAGEARPDRPVAALQALLAGPPRDSGLARTVWPGTRLLGLTVEGGVAVVDLSSEALAYGGGSSAENLLVRSFLLTLTEFPESKRVQFLFGGKKRDYLPEGTPVAEPLARPEKLNN